MKKQFLTLIFAILSICIYAENPFKNLDFLIGNWQGIETGVAGDGIGFRSYSYILDKNFIQAHNTSTFPISEKKPRGEVHRDLVIISYNSNTEQLILRGFYVEGCTNIYVLDKEQSSDTKMVWITREIENNPGNWKGRYIIEKVSDTNVR